MEDFFKINDNIKQNQVTKSKTLKNDYYIDHNIIKDIQSKLDNIKKSL